MLSVTYIPPRDKFRRRVSVACRLCPVSLPFVVLTLPSQATRFASSYCVAEYRSLSDLRLVSLDDEPRSSVSLSSTRATTVPLPHTIYAYWSTNCHLMHLFHCGIQKENAVRKNLKPVSQQGVIPWREARRRAGEDIKRVCFMRCKQDIERLVAMSELSDATRIRFASGRGETQVRRGALCDSREAGALCDEVLRRGLRR